MDELARRVSAAQRLDTLYRVQVLHGETKKMQWRKFEFKKKRVFLAN
jgi:hypothetical protein